MREISELSASASESEFSRLSEPDSKDHRKAVAVGVFSTIIFCVAVGIWASIDQHMPACDEANHVMNGLTYSELLNHARPLRPSWWHAFFSVNNYYPPFGTLAMGATTAITNNTLLSLQILKVFWIAILSASVGTIAFRISRSAYAVGAAIALVNICPIVCELSHSALLDLPLVAMVAAGLAALYCKNGSASLTRSAITGCILGLAIMTKQVAVAFLGFPILLDVIHTLCENRNEKGFKSSMLLGIPLLCICLPWSLLNFSEVQKLNTEISVDLSKRGSTASRILFNLEYYLGSWLCCCSPLVLITAFAALASFSKTQHKKLLTLWISIVPAIIALSLISCQPARDRYVSPLVVLVSVAAATGMANLSIRNKLAASVATGLLMVIGSLQFVSFNFTPYPLNQPTWLVDLVKITGCASREHVSPFFDKSANIVYSNHANASGAGPSAAEKILDHIAIIDGENPSWLNVTASSGGLDVHQMDLITKLKGLGVKPTTSRLWTALGDKELYNDSMAGNYRWYILKEGDQGFRFASAEETSKHEHLLASVRKNCEISLTIPDSTGDIQLFRTK